MLKITCLIPQQDQNHNNMRQLNLFFAHYGTYIINSGFVIASVALAYFLMVWQKSDSNLDGTIKDGIVAIVVAMIGYVGRLLQLNQKDFNMSTSEILEKLAKNLALNPIHKKKLLALAKESLNSWNRLTVIPESGKKLKETYYLDTKYKRQFVRMDLASAMTDTKCPAVKKDVILYFDTYDLSQGEPNLPNLAAIDKILTQQIALLAEKTPQSTILFKTLSHDQLKKEILIWVKLPNYIISKVDQIENVLNVINSVFKKIFNDFYLTVELYASCDITKEKTEVTVSANDKIADEGNLLPAYLYTVYRNIAYERLSGSRIFGRPDLPPLKIPVSLMEGRLKELQDGIVVGWTSIVISGSAGSGKTELAHLFIQSYAQNTKDYIIYCNRTEAYQVLENPDTYKSHEHFLDKIANFMSSSDAIGNLDSAKLVSANYPSPYKDALLNRLNKGTNKILLFIDNLESNSELKNTLIQKQELFKIWGIKLLLISRSEMPTFKTDFTINLPLWTRQEAVSILSEWNPHIDNRDITLQSYISEHENSSYLLRVIARRNELNKSVDDMLREELEDILDPLKRLQYTIKSSPEALLLEVIKQIEQGKPHLEILGCVKSLASIDIIDLMSKIAWYTKFNINILGSAQEEQKFRSGLIKPSVIGKFATVTDEQAGAFIEMCIMLRIMGGKKHAAYWVDHLVPDGSIALQLKQDIVTDVNRNIQEQLIRKLDSSNSLSFLNVVMDLPLFDALLESHSTFSLTKLLTPQVSKSLTQHPEAFNSIASSILIFTETLPEYQQKEWLPIITSLYPNSLYIQQSCHESILNKKKTNYYMSILFNQLKFDDVIQRYNQIVGSKELAVLALKYGKSEDWVPIINQVLHEFSDYSDSLQNEWKMFVCRTESTTLPLLLEMILERTMPLGIPSSDFKLGIRLIEEIFKLLAEQYNLKSNLYSQLSKPITEIINKILPSLKIFYPSFKDEFSIMVKWLAFHTNKQLTNLSATYFLKKIGSDDYAIPNICQRIKNNIAAIRENIYNGFPSFKLPTKNDLLPDLLLVNELVADGFPSDYNYSKTYLLPMYAWKRIIKGGSIQSLTEAEKRNDYLLHWRSIFKV